MLPIEMRFYGKNEKVLEYKNGTRYDFRPIGFCFGITLLISSHWFFYRTRTSGLNRFQEHRDFLKIQKKNFFLLLKSPTEKNESQKLDLRGKN